MSYDYVIIGGGTAGSIIAARLAKHPEIEVCLIEAGPSDEGIDAVRDLQAWPTLLGGDLDWNYKTQPVLGGHPDIRASRAKVLGGCSSHNTGIAYPATRSDLEAWEKSSPGWGPDACEPYFALVKERVPLEWAPGGCQAADDFVDACESLGFDRFTEMGDASRAGAGRTTVNARWPHRASSSASYLHPLSALPSNLTILTGTLVESIIFEDSRAVGVSTDKGRIDATREVILCGGAFASPQLLMLSGIGPEEHLVSLGIDVKVDLPVGEHLLDHPEGVLTYATNRTVTHEDTMWVDSVLLAGSELIPSGDPDMMIWFFSGDFDEITTVGGQLATDTNRFSIAPDVTHPRSEGWVRLRSTDPRESPEICFNYFSDPEGYDEKIMLEAIKLSRRVVSQSPLADWVEREIAPGAHVESDEDLLAYMRASTYTAHHPSGTCRMSEVDGVVDSALKVRGVRGLRVADASVFPRMIGLNLCITTMMVGERCADLVMADFADPAKEPVDRTEKKEIS